MMKRCDKTNDARVLLNKFTVHFIGKRDIRNKQVHEILNVNCLA